MKHLIVILGIVAGVLAVFAFNDLVPTLQHVVKIAFYSVLAVFIVLMTGSLAFKRL